jgi:lysophospholipase L1-like esterase
LIAALQIDDSTCTWNYTNVGVGSTTVASWATSISTVLAGIATTNIHKYVVINLGVNDWVSALPNETTWKANYQTIIDAVHTKWDYAKIYIVKPWSRNHTSDAATVAGWIDALIAANSGVCIAGHDEQGWLEGGDNGVTMTTDGVHYSTAGNAECISQWETVLGF